MLSRSVQGLYWMGRYLERTERLSHLLQLQTEALVDRPVRDIYAGWRRIYGGLQREPPVGSLSLADSDDLELVWSPRSDDFTLADSYTLAGDLTFERTNPDSILNCLAQGRENARQTRHLITTEMWLRLNLAYLRIRNLEIEDIWAALPEDFYAGIIAETDAFAGAAAATMYRDEGWRFLQQGRFVERAQFLPALLLAQMAIDAWDGEYAEGDWTSLLRICHALEAYERSHGTTVRADAALDLLVTDPLLPSSLYRSLNEIAGGLALLGGAPGADSGVAAQRTAGRLLAALQYDWPDKGDREALLRQALDQCDKLHYRITEAYFDYPA